jgi:Mg2+/Co2+ transporter CorB
MDPISSAAIILGCLAMSAFFSGSETALLRLRAHEVEQDVRAAIQPAPVAVRNLLASTSRLLVTILLGNNIVNILGSAVAAALAISYLGEKNGILLATACMTALVLIFAEVLPKAVAARYPRRISYVVGLPLYLLHWALRPIHLLFDLLIEPVVKRVSGLAEDEAVSSAEDVLRLARRAKEDGLTHGSPLAIMGATAGAAQMTVQEIMVPRTEVAAFPIDAEPSDLLEQILQERYTRVPIYESDIDKILGVVHLKDLIKLVRGGGSDLHSILKPVLRVPERKPILPLLADMQRAFVHVAIVKDEFGVTEGLVTQEDILEEIVGEIRDEFDREELLDIRKLGDGSYEALGRVTVLDFNRETSWEIPAERGDTLSGLIFNELGRAPNRSDVVRLPGYEFGVADISGTRITRVRVRKCVTEDVDKQANGRKA